MNSNIMSTSKLLRSIYRHSKTMGAEPPEIIYRDWNGYAGMIGALEKEGIYCQAALLAKEFLFNGVRVRYVPSVNLGALR